MGRERERERESEEKGGEGSSPRGSNSGDHRLQNLGHHGRERVREMGEREIAARDKSNEANGSRGGGAHGVGRGARGARAGPGRTEPGWVGSHHGSKPTTRTTIKWKSIANQNPKQNETNTRHQTKKCALA
jgi:hypothetical protein